MVKRNCHLQKLAGGYLFPEINKRKIAFLTKNPGARLISLGIGDTTEPLTPAIVEGLKQSASSLGTIEGYRGYGPEQGDPVLREKIAERIYKNQVKKDDIFISDGSKCDIGRLQVLFGSDKTMAVQNPAYPVYVDSSIIMGQTGIVYLECKPENDFFPDLTKAPQADLVYFCSPNNPTGAVATREQLTRLLEWVQKHKSCLIFDAAYAAYIQDPAIPRSIYEIEGADQVAIELGSFSKLAGFTGVRLAWSVIPEALKYEDGSSVKKDWSRLHSTLFNGASNLAQAGAIAVLTTGWNEVQTQIGFYLENTHLLRTAFLDMGLEVHGGKHAPYLWVRFPGKTSWQAFDDLLASAHIISTPGSGFGPAGEGFLRFSAFGHRENIYDAIGRLKDVLSGAKR